MTQDTIIALSGSIIAAIVTIAGLYFKDRADDRRWRESRERSAERHSENVGKLDSIHADVNGKMAQLVETSRVTGVVEGLQLADKLPPVVHKE